MGTNAFGASILSRIPLPAATIMTEHRIAFDTAAGPSECRLPRRYRAYRAPRARAKRAGRNARAKCVKCQETKKEAKKRDRNCFRSPWVFPSRLAI
jgi:hypothetical protein